MLIKEYRIALPMSVDEYRIAQLYMIQRKSREESHGEGSGVEILVNEPYKDGPGGDGQYTYKIYHIGSHLPSWFRAILPKSALRVEEEAWNAYPYTKTRYRCPFIEKFLLEIETKYLNDNGKQENLFSLSSSELKNRQLDYLDIVKDPISSGDYKKEEDPKLFKSAKTGRGPLTDNWRDEYSKDTSNRAIMTAYKLCRVEFRYWGMQNKIERFIHDIALRKTMLRAHRQAWCWQDEWYGLKLVDIRRLEKETQMALAKKMADVSTDDTNNHKNEKLSDNNVDDELKNMTSQPKIPVSVSSDQVCGSPTCFNDSTSSLQDSAQRSLSSTGLAHRKSLTNSMKNKSAGGSSRDISASRMFESLEQLQESSSDEEIYFDAKGYNSSMDEMQFWSDEGSEIPTSESEDEERERSPLMRSSSIDLVTSGDEYADAVSTMSEEYTDTPLERKLEQFRQHYSLDHGKESSPPSSAGCKTSILFLVVHGGNILDSNTEHLQASKRSDFSTVKSTFEQVIRTHYPGALGHIAFRLVPCPQICTETLSILSSLSPYVCDAQTPKSPDAPLWSQEFIPLGAIALFASSNPDYHEFVNKMVSKANTVFKEFLSADEGKGFTGQVCLLADATGSLLTYDALCLSTGCNRGMSTYDSHTSLNDPYASAKHDVSPNRLSHNETNRQLSQSDPDLSKNIETSKYEETTDKQFSKSDIVSAEFKLKRQSSNRYNATYLNVNEQAQESSRRTSTGSYFDGNYIKFDFEVTDLFMLGSPLGLVLSYRRMFTGEDKNYSPPGPACHQVFNLFHASDPTAVRLEPLIHQVFKHVPPIRVSRYNKFPLGDGEPVHVVEAVQNNLTLFTDTRRGPGGATLQRHGSLTSLASQMSGLGETTVSSITNVTSRWWGNKRLDYMLYCPEVLHSFPVAALPHLFHASFWESCDVMAFILRQVLRHDILISEPSDREEGKLGPNTGLSAQPKEKWLKRRTTIKVKNLQPNHRGNDSLVLEDKPQKLTARFMYGSFDVTSLSGERVDVHVMEQPTGEWKFLGTAVTDKHGKLVYTIPTEKSLPQGMHPVKIVVRGDHSTADFFLTVLPPKTETVVFSIDGSFTASMSISGKDPKVRAGAVDVVRHWQDQGYLILYVTARPDMQHRKVVSWLAMHNFPHGMVAFMDGLSKEPLKQKRNYLKSLQTEADVVFKAGYGSGKDIYVYKELGLTPQQIFIVGKTSKKLMSQAQVLSSGYADHLSDLLTPGYSRPAIGNARHFIQKGCFSKPSQSDHSKKQVKRLSSNQGPTGEFLKQSDGPLQTIITVGEDGNTVVQLGHGGPSRKKGSTQGPVKQKNLKDVPR